MRKYRERRSVEKIKLDQEKDRERKRETKLENKTECEIETKKYDEREANQLRMKILRAKQSPDEKKEENKKAKERMRNVKSKTIRGRKMPL